MATGGPIPIPFPTSSFPGANSQESAGRLINCYAEPLGEGGPAAFKWIRSAGLSQHAATGNSGYRGGLVVNNASIECWSGNASSVDAAGSVTPIGIFPGTSKVSLARNQASPVPDVVAVDPNVGAYVLESAGVLAATAMATIGGTTFNVGDVVVITILNPALSPPFPISISHTLVGVESATTIATALTTTINANTTLAAANVTALSAAEIITISHQGAIGNQSSLVSGVSGTGNETVAFSSTNLSGGQGTFGAFTGTPTIFNGGGVLPQPNSVCFQDGYLFFTVGDGKIYATTLNGLAMNGLTFITIQSKSDVTLLRGIAFSGFLLAFTTGSCEVWQDAANAAPNFPYGRIGVLEFGLVQSSAIAGWETGFSELLWVAQDFGVHWMTAGQLGQIKASPPDLDRLIEQQARLGNVIEAGCYIAAGKKFWTVSSPAWTWEFNLQTKKWNERWSLASGQFGRWRGTGGHPAFGKWLMGDQQTGNLLFTDDTNPTDNGAVQLCRIESGPVRKFPEQVRIARADFDFVFGVGQQVGSAMTTVRGTSRRADGAVALAVVSTSMMRTGDTVIVAGIVGTTEANGTWVINVIDAMSIKLLNSIYANVYASGGTVADLTSPSNAINPTVAISTSKDGGFEWGNPLMRPLNAQSNSLRGRAMVTNMGLSGAMGNRWRLDVSDPVYFSFMGGTQSSELRAVGR